MIAEKKAGVYETAISTGGFLSLSHGGSIPDAVNANEFAFTIGSHALRK